MLTFLSFFLRFGLLAVILMEGGTEFDLKAIDGPSNNKLDSTAKYDVLKM